jgi:hypothetical protein
VYNRPCEKKKTGKLTGEIGNEINEKLARSILRKAQSGAKA